MRGLLIVLAACGSSSADPDAACQRSILYLNRTGAMFTKGPVDDSAQNVSTIVDVPRMLAPYPHDNIEWGFTTACIRTALQPFPIQVVETDPGLAQHTELVFTTSYWGTPAGITHAIPDSCRPNHEVAFVFGGAIATDARACQVAMIAFAQMTALLSYGDNCRDLLDQSMDCVQDRSFIDETVACVDMNDQPIACRCGGMTQNTFQALAAAHPACP